MGPHGQVEAVQIIQRGSGPHATALQGVFIQFYSPTGAVGQDELAVDDLGAGVTVVAGALTVTPAPRSSRNLPPVPKPLFPDIYGAATQSFGDLRAMEAREKQALIDLEDSLPVAKIRRNEAHTQANKIVADAQVNAADIRSDADINIQTVESAISEKHLRIADLANETDDALEALVEVLQGRLARRRSAQMPLPVKKE